MRGEHLHTELMSKSNSKIIISRGIYWLILLVRSLEDLGSTMSVKQSVLLLVDSFVDAVCEVMLHKQC